MVIIPFFLVFTFQMGVLEVQIQNVNFFCYFNAKTYFLLGLWSPSYAHVHNVTESRNTMKLEMSDNLANNAQQKMQIYAQP